MIFLCAYVTEPPAITDESITKAQETSKNETNNCEPDSNAVGTPPTYKLNIISNIILTPGNGKNSKTEFVSPEIFKGFPKADERKEGPRKRKFRRT